jgi:hypothetical protein
MYQLNHQKRQYCPECYISTDGVPRASPCVHGCRDQCAEGCGERCYHNLWSNLTGCADCRQQYMDRPMVPQAVTDNDEQCERLVATLESELRRLSMSGMENWYLWSRILYLVIWVSLLCTTNARVLTVYRSWQLDDVRAKLREYLSRHEAHTPLQLIGWLRSQEVSIQTRASSSRETVHRELRGLMKYAYLCDYIQELDKFCRKQYLEPSVALLILW